MLNDYMLLSNWMSYMPDDRKIILSNIICAHDAAACYVNPVLSSFGKTQALQISELLNNGVRIFDIRVDIKDKNKKDDEDLICVHGICDCFPAPSSFLGMFKQQYPLTFKSVLIQMEHFLSVNKSEFLMIKIESGRNNEQANLKRAYEIFHNIMGYCKIEYSKDLTYKDVRGKAIFNVHYNINSVTGTDEYYRNNIYDGYNLEDIHSAFGDYPAYKVNGQQKINEILEFYHWYNITIDDAIIDEEQTPNKYPFNFSISCTGEYGSKKGLPYPEAQANIVNPFFSSFVQVGNYYGFISMDFITKEVAAKFIETNFKQDYAYI